MAAQRWGSAPLQPVLRLIHCTQTERGASCALAGSLARRSSPSDGGSSEENPCEGNLRSARIASNSAISSFYRSAIWHSYCRGNEAGGGDLNLATMLCHARALVDQGLGVADEKDSAAPQKEHLFFHDVLVEFSSFLSSVIEVFVVKEVTKRKIELQTKINAPKLLNEVRRNAKVGLSLLELVLSFVTLKESLGMERATLSGLMANGIAETNDESIHTEVVEAPSHLNLIVNDLVLVVENQHRIMRDLRKLLGLNIRRPSVASDDTGVEIKADELLFDENYCTLLLLVGESIRQSDGLGSLQEQIMNDFDIQAFQQAMKMEDFWAGITLYMDQLHSMELFLLEELENCEGGFEDLDLISLESGAQSSQSTLNLERLSLSFGGISEHNTVETISKMTQEELKDTLLSLLAQTYTHKECQPSQLPVSPDKSKAGKITQLPSPTRIKDHQKPALEEWEINLYEVEFHKRIGRGSAGTTYLGKYANQDVAVKVGAHTDMGLEGWTAELTSLKKMHHTNIIRFLGAIYNKTPLTYCLVLEYCDGGDLFVALSGNTPPKFFSNVTSGIASGLCYLHQKKYMHRDIKPSNVLLSGNLTSGQYTAKLTDFGLAVKVQTTSVTSGKKDLTAETGTYRYMAPEVIRHELYGYAADVYSFGLLMWAMITHETPFENKGPIEAAGSVALEGKRPPFPNDTPLTVKALIENCWAEKPSERSDVVGVVKSLDELGRNAATESWLSAPAGHPVYKQVLRETPQQGIADSSLKVQPTKKVSVPKKKVSVLKSGLLFRRRKSDQ